MRPQVHARCRERMPSSRRPYIVYSLSIMFALVVPAGVGQASDADGDAAGDNDLAIRLEATAETIASVEICAARNNCTAQYAMTNMP